METVNYMGKHKGSIGSLKLQLVSKAKEAALCAIIVAKGCRDRRAKGRLPAI